MAGASARKMARHFAVKAVVERLQFSSETPPLPGLLCMSPRQYCSMFRLARGPDSHSIVWDTTTHGHARLETSLHIHRKTPLVSENPLLRYVFGRPVNDARQP
jgi:hypothetical protein